MKVNHNEIFKYYQKGIYPACKKLYAIGDIHGDFNALIICLTKIGLIDDKYHWCGGEAHVVQVGDILDRKIRDTEYTDEDSEFKIISLIMTLQLESFLAGGGFHPIIGNHELMNILGIFDYVSPMGMQHFNSPNDRYEYFKIGGDFSTYLACAWNPIIKIGDFIFCHGGISANIAEKYSIEKINLFMRDTLYGNADNLNKKIFNELFLDSNSILWNRDFSTDTSKQKEEYSLKELNIVLKKFESKYIVLGHTPSINGIKTRFNGKVFCVDTAMSEAFGKKYNKNERIHYLEILSSENKIYLY
jgi:hypothetical protein